MFKNKIIVGSSITLAILLVVYLSYIYGVYDDKKDNYWFYLDTVLVCNGFENPQIDTTGISKKHKITTLKENLGLLQNHYSQIHKNSSDTLPIIEELSNPFFPTWEYEKLNKYLSKFLEKKFIIISGTTGAGKTTLVDNLAKIITGNPKRLLSLRCVEEMGVEYHKLWIGNYKQDTIFEPGIFLEFLLRSQNDTSNNYLFIIDDFDKIYPATFFGSEIWNELDNIDKKEVVTYIKGYKNEIYFPKNFYIIAVTHTGVANVISLNDEHYRRLGEKITIGSDEREFLLYLKERKIKDSLTFNHSKKLIYLFYNINKLIANKYNDSYCLGQWSNLKKKLKPSQLDQFINTFIEHVNSLKPNTQMKYSDLDFIFYAIYNNGDRKSVV